MIAVVLENLKDTELKVHVFTLVAQERKLTAELVSALKEVHLRKLHLAWGYASLFDYVHKGLGYCPGSASRRVNAVQLACQVKGVEKDLETGVLSLSRAQAVNQFFKKEKWSDQSKNWSGMEKQGLFEKVKTVPRDEAEQKLAQAASFEDPGPRIRKRRVLATGEVHLHFKFDAETIEKMKRAKELLSHRYPVLGDADLFRLLITEFIERKDPLLKKAKRPLSSSSLSALSATHPPLLDPRCTAEPPRTKQVVKTEKKDRTPVPAKVKQSVWKRDAGKCTYKDPSSGKQCESRYRVQIDHIYPVSKGGSNALENLTLLCQAHNLYKGTSVLPRGSPN